MKQETEINMCIIIIIYTRWTFIIFSLVQGILLLIFQCHTVTHGTDLRRSPHMWKLLRKTAKHYFVLSVDQFHIIKEFVWHFHIIKEWCRCSGDNDTCPQLERQSLSQKMEIWTNGNCSFGLDICFPNRSE